MTQLNNRSEFDAALEASINAAGQVGAECALVTFDLDRFKGVNDTLGHPVGDALLVSVADRLKTLAEGQLGVEIARLGGDEFCAWFVQPAGSDRAALFAAELLKRLSAPHVALGHTLLANASVGTAVFPKNAPDARSLIELSDLALNHAKASGRGVVVSYQDGMADELRLRQALEVELAEAIAQDKLHLAYQPFVDLATGSIVGVEALARWNHPERGAIPPSVFIPIAEVSGLVEQLGRWAFRRACLDAAKLPPHVTVAVNLSSVQFRSDVAAIADRIIRDTGVDPARLELEITESVMIADSKGTLAALERLSAMGIGIALDDFGTGYSSLSYLRQFRFRKLKIDRSFIDEIETSPEARAIVRTVIELARALGMRVTAEGVETEAQATLARLAGCDYAQGYYFARPMPIEALLAGAFAQGRAAA